MAGISERKSVSQRDVYYAQRQLWLNIQNGTQDVVSIQTQSIKKVKVLQAQINT